MSRALAYCAFLHRPEISLPETGVRSAAVQVMAERELRLLWSEVEWPFNPAQLQKNSVEFHGVVQHVLKQAAVVPFRLLSVFSNHGELAAFAAENATAFIADLERLKDFVQMESVVYPAPGRAASQISSGAVYLRERAAMLRLIEHHVAELRERLRPLARDLHVRETKSGTRLFVLAERGRESHFRELVEQTPLPHALSRRISGPWPAAEFLSDQVRTPQVAGAQ
ncbi:MAG TPA: GvpL/GvpF family gas vesicle protein [Candidatus Angelobacter sp.]|nr:GvpL/GvpF family gas vesicle protein [Candidatus Angelobacter sp.]